MRTAPSKRTLKSISRTDITFKKLSKKHIEDYLVTKEPFGKAGSYAIQGIAGKFVTQIIGSRTNVIGLPVETFLELYHVFKPSTDK